MSTVNAVNKHQARWPVGHITLTQDNIKVTYSEFKQCVEDMSKHVSL